MRFALVDKQRSMAQPGGRALCPGCHLPVLAKCGEIMSWHWAHVVSIGCDWEPGRETDWHLSWKATAPEERQEVPLNGHRADIISPGGVVIELQHSHLSGMFIRDREHAYPQLVWLFDARTARAEGRLRLARHPDRNQDDLYRNIRWEHAPAFTGQVQAEMFLDIGNDTLIWVGGWYAEAPRQGYGWGVTAEWFKTVVVNGPRLPRKPRWLNVERLTQWTANPAQPAPATFDWHHHKIGPLRACRLCGQPASLRDSDDRPCHKVCAEDAAGSP